MHALLAHTARGGTLLTAARASLTVCLVQVTLTLVFAYLTFFVAEGVLGSSGVLAVVALGMWMSRNGREQISPAVEHFLHEFWEMLAYFGNTLIFVITGVVFVYDLLADPDCGVTVKERTKRKVFKTEKFPPCFVGAEAVTWMTENIPMLYDDRQKALNLGRMLVRTRLVAHVKNSKDFEDSPVEYYTFQKSRAEIGLPTTETSAAIAAAATGAARW